MSVKSEIRNLSKSDAVILCGGTMDVARNDSKQGLSSAFQFVKNIEHTNVIVVDTPHRFDLSPSSCVNEEVITFNRKLHKMLKHCYHTRQLNLNMQREHFTKHGLHMNGNGKERLTDLLTTTIRELFTTHPTETPITATISELFTTYPTETPTTLSWKADTTEEEMKLRRPVPENFAGTSPEQQVNNELGKHSNVTKNYIHSMLSSPVPIPTRPSPTMDEKVKQIKPVLEDSILINPEQQKRMEQRKLSNNVDQDSGNVQKAVFDTSVPTNPAPQHRRNCPARRHPDFLWTEVLAPHRN